MHVLLQLLAVAHFKVGGEELLPDGSEGGVVEELVLFAAHCF